MVSFSYRFLVVFLIKFTKITYYKRGLNSMPQKLLIEQITKLLSNADIDLLDLIYKLLVRESR